MISPLEASFDVFYNRYIKDRTIRFKRHYALTKEQYEASATFREFIINLHKHTKDCMVFDTWFSYYMKEVGIKSLELDYAFFIIPKHVIDELDEAIEVSLQISTPD